MSLPRFGNALVKICVLPPKSDCQRKFGALGSVAQGLDGNFGIGSSSMKIALYRGLVAAALILPLRDAAHAADSFIVCNMTAHTMSASLCI